MQTRELQQALIRLFAIVVAGSEGNLSERSKTVFDNYLNIHVPSRSKGDAKKLFYELIEKHNSEKGFKKVSLNSVKILRICSEINKQNKIEQRIELLIHLISFTYSLSKLTKWSLEFLQAVADALEIPPKIYLNIKNFTCGELESLLDKNLIKNFDSFIAFKPYENIYILQSRSSELYINGKVLFEGEFTIIPRGALIETEEGKYTWDIISDSLSTNSGDSFCLQINSISYKIRKKQILYPTSLRLNSGDSLAVLGTSGAGKSTFLKLICNLLPVKNSITLSSSENKIKDFQTAYVPQEDALIPEFTPSQMLKDRRKLIKACKQKLSSYNNEEILQLVGLSKVREQKIGNNLKSELSGGQRKRLSIAMELLREVDILCLDEPTSGLSSGDAIKIADVTNNICNNGKIVIASLHQPSFELLNRFNKILLIDKGGYPVYYGTPAEAPGYFRNIAEIADNTGLNCPACGSYKPDDLFKILEFEYNNKRRIKSETWYEYYLKEHVLSVNSESSTEQERVSKQGSFIKKTITYLQRDFKRSFLKISTFLMNLALPIILIVLIGLISRAGITPYTLFHNPNLPAAILMLIVAALFTGMVSTGTYINGDSEFRPTDIIIDKSQKAYLFSKLLQAVFWAAIASLIFTTGFLSFLSIHDLFTRYFIIVFLTTLFGSLTGLVLSKWIRSATLVYLLVPALIIPQLMLSGLVIDYNNLPQYLKNEEYVPLIAEPIASRWAFEALCVNQYTNNDYEFYFNQTRQELHRANYYLFYFIPLVEDTYKTNAEGATQIIKNEQNKYYHFPQFSTDNFNSLNFLKHYFNQLRQNAINEEDQIKSQLKKVYDLNQLSSNYTNSSLNKLLFNVYNDKGYKIISNNVIRKYAPVYHIPYQKFGRAHMFAPYKRMGNYLISTHNFNSLILTLMNLLLTILLFINIPKRNT
ncbi:MAG: ATP-binding cassette domain-containing protein [Bacteroidales bacterium]|nr:ATP-binding cassette domain-containing protein [Bacteroidales bacterium]